MRWVSPQCVTSPSLQTQSDVCFVFFFKEKVDILNIFAQLDIFTGTLQ